MATTSKATELRILTWRFALFQATNYLYAAQHALENYEEFPDFITARGETRTIGIPAPCYSGLTEAAAVLVRQVFSSGKEGQDSADNQSPEVNSIRSLILDNTKASLQWDEDRFTDFCRELRNQRNRFLAHYDGTYADYNKVSVEISKFRKLGLCFTKEDVDQFLDFAIALENAICEFLIIANVNS